MRYDDLPDHGTLRRYNFYRCRCVLCRRRNSARVFLQRMKRYAEAKDPQDPRHGSASFYQNNGCRCGPCTFAATDAALVDTRNRKQVQR